MIKEEELSERLPGPSKKCNCKNSKCIKLYCECYQASVCCDSTCHCHNCYNNPTNERYRNKAMQNTLEKNPSAFQPKIITSDSKPDPLNLGKHNKGCACRKSGCMKKYCECFQAKVPCSDNCKCCECRNHGFLTRDHFLRSTRSEDDNFLYPLLLAKDKDHFETILAFQNRREVFDQKEIEQLIHKMKKILVNPMEQEEKDEIDYICDEEESAKDLSSEKTKLILDIFIDLLKHVEEK